MPRGGGRKNAQYLMPANPRRKAMDDETKKPEQPEQKPASPELSEQDLENVAGGKKVKFMEVTMENVIISGYTPGGPSK
jgi:hypothetical protein